MIIEVFLYGQKIGSVEWSDERRRSLFQYSSQIINTIEPSPIIMPTSAKSYETTRDHENFHNLPYLLSDSMPDDFDNTMMKRWLQEQSLSIKEINPVDRLSYVGNRGMGALEFVPAMQMGKQYTSLEINDIYKIAKDVLRNKKEIIYPNLDEEGLSQILRIGTSVGGARAKALIAIQRDESGSFTEVRPGDILQPEGYSYWLLKIDGVNKHTLGEGEGIGKIEYAYYLMAKEAGIDISESFLHEEHDRFHFMTKRFDRTDTGEKIHMQSMGAIAGIDFRIPKASSYETLFRIMKRLWLPYNQFEEQFRRMIFNVVTRNQDDHVKNFSFLMDKTGKWRISPAYDLCYSYNPEGRWTGVHQSSINGKYDNYIKSDFTTIANTFGIKKPEIIISQVTDAASKWVEIAKEVEIPSIIREEYYKNFRMKW